MKEFKCKDAGHACDWKVQDNDEKQIVGAEAGDRAADGFVHDPVMRFQDSAEPPSIVVVHVAELRRHRVPQKVVPDGVRALISHERHLRWIPLLETTPKRLEQVVDSSRCAVPFGDRLQRR